MTLFPCAMTLLPLACFLAGLSIGLLLATMMVLANTKRTRAVTALLNATLAATEQQGVAA